MRLVSRLPLICLITTGSATAENFGLEGPRILDLVKAAVECGIPLIQIREKQLTARLLFSLTKEAAAITRSSETKLLVNDRSDIAAAAGADGVHLTSRSLPASVVRQAFGVEMLIGVSTHSLEEVTRAADGGADFAVFGPVFETPGKGLAVGLDELGRVCRAAAPFPVLGLGGIDETNAAEVLDAGAAGFAAIRALSGAGSLQRICGRFIGAEAL